MPEPAVEGTAARFQNPSIERAAARSHIAGYAGVMDDFGLDLPPRHTADIDGPVHYREWDGPPGHTFVLVHGLGGSHLNWWKVAPRLSDRGRVLALDLAGFGLTPRAGRGSDVRSNRILLSRFLRELDAAPALLVGNSMGGAIALVQTAVEPATVEGLILSSAALPWVPGVRPAFVTEAGFNLYRVPGLGAAFGRWRIKGMAPERTTEIGMWLVTADPSALDEGTLRSQTEMVRLQQANPDAVPAFLEAARSLMRLGSYRRATREILDGVDCPVLVLHGDHDKLVPLAFARDAVRRHPAWDLRIFHGVGHAIQLEAPDRWMAAVGDWLDRPAPRPVQGTGGGSTGAGSSAPSGTTPAGR